MRGEYRGGGDESIAPISHLANTIDMLTKTA
jgi:hypothetical protein